MFHTRGRTRCSTPDDDKMAISERPVCLPDSDSAARGQSAYQGGCVSMCTLRPSVSRQSESALLGGTAVVPLTYGYESAAE